MSSILLLLPDFALILLGFGLRRQMHLGDHFWSGLEKLIYFVLFPALLFHAIARTRIDFAAAAPFVASGMAAMCGGMLLGLLARPLFGPRPMAFASQFQCAFRFNSYIGLAVAAKLHGEAGIAALGILIGAMVPLANLASVWMLARHGQSGVLREIARNPLILGTLAGLLFNLSGLALPEVAGQFLGRLSEASIALGLLAVGAALKLRGGTSAHPPTPAPRAGVTEARFARSWLTAPPWGGPAAGRCAAGYFVGVKLLAVPAIAWGAARALGLQGVYFDVVVMFGALPTASSAYILAMRMGGDGAGVAWLISASTLGAMLTMPLWLVALGAA
ncbi:MAG: AEC family transporter [Rhodocyclales bacterium]|nr:AEC family transporter [Rhodocyclales bacterium]